MRRTIFLAISFAVLCSAGMQLSAAPSSNDTYRKPIPSFPVTFNPRLYADAYSILVSSQIYDRLFELDEYLSIKPKLVAKWDVQDDGRVWIFYLREDVKFHNGKPFSAKDVEFTLLKLLKKDSIKKTEFAIIKGAKEYTEGKAKNVSGIQVVAPNTLRIELTQPFQPFIGMFTAPNLEIIPDDLAGQSESDFFMHPIGTGPFKFESLEPDKAITITANDSYFLGPPKLRTIIFQKVGIREATEGFNKGYYHDLEWYLDIDPKTITRSYSMLKTPSAAVYFIAFNTRHKPFDNVHTRRAINLAIDKQRLLSECFPDRTLANGFIPPSIGGYYPDMPKVGFDLKAAQNEIRQAKLTKKEQEGQYIILRPDNHPCGDKFGRFIEDSMKKIGLNIKVQPLQLGKLYDDYYWSRKFDMFNMYFTADHPEAWVLLNQFRSSHPDNFTGTKSQQIDNLLSQASITYDRYERFRLYQQIQQILQKDAPVIPLFYNLYTSIYQSNVRGLVRYPLTIYALPMRTIYFDNTDTANLMN